MSATPSRRAFLGLACASTALLAACGSSSIVSALKPSRFLAVGDGFSDLGETGVRYTVNDGSVNIWTQQLVSYYSQSLVTRSAGGLSYARKGSLIAGAAPSIEAQVTQLLAENTLGPNDVVLVGAGMDEIIAAVTATGISDATTTRVRAAGDALAAQVRRLVAAGAKYVLVAGVYNLGISPWAAALNQKDAIRDLTINFNNRFLVTAVDLGNNVLFVDTALYFNLVQGLPSGYGISNATAAACATPDASTCNPNTIVSGIDYTTALFADSQYFTPLANRMFGTEAFNKLTGRW